LAALAAPASSGRALQTYWSATRAPRYSLVFALPLFLLYEALAASLSEMPGAVGVRNAADVILKTPFLLFAGTRGSLAFFATVMAVCVFLVVRDLRKTRDTPRARTFLLMLGESAVLALLLGVVVGTITQRLLHVLTTLQSSSGAAGLEGMSGNTKLMLALGAGLYEELLFRVIIVGGIAAGLRTVLGARRLTAGIIAAVAGALIFSTFHYIGEYGDKFTVASFMFRAIAGLAFSGLFLIRGFGITAWSHALYDCYVMLL
jgi:hypothetical protein